MTEPASELSEFVEQVLDVVDQIPRGQVMSYGEVADVLGVGAARQVGTVMRKYGYRVPWWRVVRSDGSITSPLMVEAATHWEAEGTPMRGGKVDMSRAVSAI